jgi:hypothetical protein
MPAPSSDPYQVLGVRPDASDDELHAAYRRLVQLHHPDHNRGSLEATRRFEEVQAAYAEIREQRAHGPARGPAPTEGQTSTPRRPPPPADPAVEARIADLERELREARAASERARRAARAEAAASYERPSDEELGYVKTDDTIGKILADARTELTDRLAQEHERPLADRVADLLDEVAAKLRDEPAGGSRD